DTLLATDAELNKLEALLDLGEVLKLVGDPFDWPLQEALRLAERKGNAVAAERARELLGSTASAA
ncbi:MAG TPA: hypothetical protein VFR32_08750, partial [Gaiellaceae bacterium]|nr:hypothetical protein [Gaiellaceae bacterium]